VRRQFVELWSECQNSVLDNATDWWQKRLGSFCQWRPKNAMDGIFGPQCMLKPDAQMVYRPKVQSMLTNIPRHVTQTSGNLYSTDKLGQAVPILAFGCNISILTIHIVQYGHPKKLLILTLNPDSTDPYRNCETTHLYWTKSTAPYHCHSLTLL